MTLQGSAATHPAVGTIVDDGALQLVEVLGIGGYGVCYKAIDHSFRPSRTVAVKCLILSQPQNSRQRQLHMREVMLHQLASAHPNVVSLRRIVQEGTHTYIVMDFAPDGDLFSQILNQKRYLGNDALIKHVFLQLLDAVEYCHRLGIYHRDLKPENVLCFDGGHSVAITDFGLATTDKVSGEFRTGSIYHMSPECHGAGFTMNRSYSPLHNDVWSLAVVLLNLTTGRNPWKSATMSDPTFQAYVEDPFNFLPSVLPISQDMNSLLVHMLALDWRDRPSVAEIRMCFETIDSFYAPEAIFEGSMASCPWEGRIDGEEEVVPSDLEQGPPTGAVSKAAATTDTSSRWSEDSGLESDFAFAAGGPLTDGDEQWSDDDNRSSWLQEADLGTAIDMIYDLPGTPPFTHSMSSNDSSIAMPSFPTTPSSAKTSFNNPLRKNLVINTACGRMKSLEDGDSLRSSLMLTAKGSPCSDTLPDPSLVNLAASDSRSCCYSDTDDDRGVDFVYASPVSPPSIHWSRFGIEDEDKYVGSQLGSSQAFKNPTFCHVAHSEASNANNTPTTYTKAEANVDHAKFSSVRTCKQQEQSSRRKNIFSCSPRSWFTTGRFFTAVEAS